MNIELIFYSENGEVEYGGMKEEKKNIFLTLVIKKSFFSWPLPESIR